MAGTNVAHSPHPSPPADDSGNATRSRATPATASAGGHARQTLDRVVAVLLLLCLLPLLLIVAVLIKLDSPGPVFFRQRRLGKDRRPFMVVKFRTMRTDASSDIHMRYIADLAAGSSDPSALKKLTNDPRVTPLGRTLRRLSIDEIPQLFNVIVGQMALVGPRPALEYEIEHYEPIHFQRFDVRPGITGLWQVSGRSTVGFKEMLDLDVEYAVHGTFFTDLRILVKTPLAAVRDAA